MKVHVESASLLRSNADLVAVACFESASLPYGLADQPGGAEAQPGFKKLSLIHPDGDAPSRVLAVGLGAPKDLDPERLRVAAAVAAKEAKRLKLNSVAWALPPDGLHHAETAAALVAGTMLADWSFDRFKSKTDEQLSRPDGLESLTLVLDSELVSASAAEVDAATVAAEAERVAAAAQNRARDLQSLPGNLLTPSALAERAAQIAAAFDRVSDETLGPEEIAQKEMGGMIAVSKGSAEPERLIVLRYSGGGDGPVLGLVGKSVTFDTGGISLKPPASMPDMKMDMSGGAAVIEAVAAIAELELPVNLIAVMPAVENMPSGTATRPGDIITQYNGKTVEVNNTDAEGRLVLADALSYCVELGAERVVDLATLTGAVLIALGSTYSALIANDDELAAAVTEAGDAAGDLAWRLPLHEEFKDLTRGTVADLTNSSPKRKAGTIYAGSFLEEFVGDVPWVHLDIAGTAWDTGRAYLGNGPTGVGVRLLVNLARSLS